MSNAPVEQIRAIQASMVESGGSFFLASELDDMRCLIRLTVEFFYYLQGEDVAPFVEDKLRYVRDSVFSGLSSFDLVSAAYRTLPGARATTLASSERSTDSVKEEFAAKYREFSDEMDFEAKCRLLLDLFKLQIVFAGLSC
ncbi:MAG TPA: hypothetical protein VHB50_08530 [Bryobacteraceae bacterium]|nr:hypothetical protein [Bryobacteraceae bacterium]